MNNVRKIVNTNSVASGLKDNLYEVYDTSDNWKTNTDDDVASAGSDKNETAIKKLRLLCAETLASMPYGEEVLEELASVAQNIGEVNAQSRVGKMPYPLPNLPHINDLQVSIATESQHKPSQQSIAIRQPVARGPPRVPEPPSKYNSWLGLPTDADPKLLVCLSPSQRTYMSEKQMIACENKPDQLLDAHQKFIERRGYHEYTIDQVNAMDSANLEEQQILKTAALMKKLRKSLTPPPPPIPPPPVPSKSSETAAKAQNQTKAAKSNYDVRSRNANEQAAAVAAPDTDGEENKHRLLAIIHDTNEFKKNKQEQPPPPPPPKASTSSYENNSGQTSGKQGGPLHQPDTQQPQAQMSNSGRDRYTEQSQSVIKSSNEHQHKRTIVSATETSTSATKENVENAENYTTKLPQTDNSKMQGVDSELAKMFPNISNIFDSDKKRFSNIETSSGSPYCSQLLSTQPKRYSNIETHSYESKKRIENGQVVYDVSNTKHESQTDGGKPSADAISASSPAMQFPLKVDIGHHQTKNPFDNDSGMKIFGKSESDGIEKCKVNPTKTSSSADEEIMSALKLNTTNSTQTATAATSIEQQLADNSQSKLSEMAQQERTELFKNRQERENISTFKKDISSTYDEFRQRAKAAAETASSAPPTTPATAPASTTFTGDQLFSSHHFDHEKLFKDFDDLSKQLNMELESGKAEREQREKSASLYDLSRMQARNKFEDFKKERHEHMKELEREIERSMRSRQDRSRLGSRPETATTTFDEQPQNSTPTMPRYFEIPIQLENGANATGSGDRTEPNLHRTYEIPVQLESGYQVTTPETPRNCDYTDNARYRRAESMFNISDNVGSSHRRDRTSSNNYDGQPNPDDWYRYASDFGSSENITRPFAREVEICYQRLRPQAIRAPRMSVSTNDLSANSVHSFDHHNAYNIRRTNAPMLSQAPVQKNRPQYLSCTSMIERDPNPTYISTTSRRGVSPAPPTPPTPTSSSNHYSSDVRNTAILHDRQRRSSLPRELHERQLKYILSKEDELKTEFERLQNERRRLIDEMNRPQPPPSPMQMTPPQRHMRDVYRPTPKLPTLSEDEVFRQQMAEEWLNKVAEREERRLQKIIKISKIHEDGDHKIHTIHHHHPDSLKPGISEEFLSRVKERRSKLSMPADSDWESGAESQPVAPGHASETEDVAAVKVIEGKSEANLSQLPRHLREFAKFSNHESEKIDGGHREVHQEEERRQEASENSVSSAMKKSSIVKTVKISRQPTDASDLGQITSSSQDTTPHTTAQRAPAKHPQDVGPHSHKKVKPIINQRVPKNQNRYNHTAEQPPSLNHSNDATTLPRKKVHTDDDGGVVASYSDKRQPPVMRNKQTRFLLTPNRRSWSETDLLNEIDNELQLAKGFLFADVYKVKHEYMSEPETENDHPKKMAHLGRRQFDGIGPVTDDGMPIVLRSEVKEPHQHEWYKRLYQTIHKQKSGDDYVIRYKCQRGRPQYKPNGYQSEPEPNYDSDYTTVKYRTLDRRRLDPVCSSTSNIRSSAQSRQEDKLYGTMPNPIKSVQNSYKNQPGRIEDYVTGHSSVSEKERKEWWDEVMDIFNGHLDQTKLSSHYTEGNLSRALAKESGYTSDSNLVFRKKEVPQSSPLSPVEQKQAYKSVQSGGEPPLFGFRKPAPEKPKESPNRYYESDVNIHFKTPVRNEYKNQISEEDLAIRQADHMQKLYQEERRRKYLQELQDMNSRRHTDNFTPTQKSPIPLNRYDDFQSDLAPKSPNPVIHPKAVARALYNFQGQSARELSFRKGDVIYIRRVIDKNWYEGEHNAMIGLLPVNYIEIINKDGIRQPPRKPSEGQARAKYNFQAQSGVELSLNKGELVTLTRRVDDNWFEGKIANRKGIFPISYVEVLTDIGADTADVVITESSTTNLRPSLDTLRTNINNEFNMLTQNGHQAPNGILKETKSLHTTDALHVDTNTEPLRYRALYKYRPQNSDELELLEGDFVHVLEKCDDGWFVGTSQRTGCFGTFPGNYVERV